MALSRGSHVKLVPPDAGEGSDALAAEAALVEHARAGGGQQLGTLFRLHAPRLLPMLVRLLASHSDAEDSLQDTFIQAFADLGKLKDARAFGGWLRQIAVHQAHRRFRRRRLLAVFGLDRHVADASLAALVSPTSSADIAVELVAIDRMLHRLPPMQRIAWMLRHVEGYELEEVATACDCSLATTKRWIAAANARVAAHVALPEVLHE